jgi:hypothetical protein
MTFEEAEKLAMTVKWKTGVCISGEICWCRTIEPIEPIFFLDTDGGKEPFFIARGGEMDKKLAEYFVKLHNEKVENE